MRYIQDLMAWKLHQLLLLLMDVMGSDLDFLQNFLEKSQNCPGYVFNGIIGVIRIRNTIVRAVALLLVC